MDWLAEQQHIPCLRLVTAVGVRDETGDFTVGVELVSQPGRGAGHNVQGDHFGLVYWRCWGDSVLVPKKLLLIP